MRGDLLQEARVRTGQLRGGGGGGALIGGDLLHAAGKKGEVVKPIRKFSAGRKGGEGVEIGRRSSTKKEPLSPQKGDEEKVFERARKTSVGRDRKQNQRLDRSALVAGLGGRFVHKKTKGGDLFIWGKSNFISKNKVVDTVKRAKGTQEEKEGEG